MSWRFGIFWDFFTFISEFKAERDIACVLLVSHFVKLQGWLNWTHQEYPGMISENLVTFVGSGWQESLPFRPKLTLTNASSTEVQLRPLADCGHSNSSSGSLFWDLGLWLEECSWPQTQDLFLLRIASACNTGTPVDCFNLLLIGGFSLKSNASTRWLFSSETEVYASHRWFNQLIIINQFPGQRCPKFGPK